MDMVTKLDMIQVPIDFLLNPKLLPSTKLIWMVLHFAGGDTPERYAWLETHAGLSRKTIKKGMAELVAAGWDALYSGKRADTVGRLSPGIVQIPASLLVDRRMGLLSRILYGYLQLTPGFHYPTGQFTYSLLSNLTQHDLKTVRRAVRELLGTGWLQVTRENQLAPVYFSLRNPKVDRGQAEVDRVRRRLDKASYIGEALMREYLSLLVDSDDFEDDAAPGFLVNPLTEERMELDRFYPPRVAFEFNGPQHYGATELFSEEKATKQRVRDYMKLGICATRGISLVIIHPEDLALESMRQKIGNLLPLRDLDGHEQLIAFLKSISRRYRLAAKRKSPLASVGSDQA